MDSPGAVGRRRGNSRINAEDQALDQIAKETSANSPPSSKKMKAICYTKPPPPPEVLKPNACVTIAAQQETSSTIEAGRSGPWSVEPAMEEICTDTNKRVLDGHSGQWVVKKRKKVNKKEVVGKIAAAFVEAIMQNFEASSDEEAVGSTPESTPEKVQHAGSSPLALTLSPYLGEPVVVTDDEDEPSGAVGCDDQVD